MSFNETGTPPPDVPDTTQGIVAPVPARTRAQNVRYGIALFVGGMFWLSTFAGTLGLLVPARLAVIAPSEKAAVLGVMVALGAVIALVANVLFGALSDMTRTRWGARTPWLLVGSVTTAGTLVGLSTAQTTGAILVWWCLNQFFLNAIVAPMIATIPDRSPRRLRGTYSAVYGVGFAIGGALSQIVGSMFITAPSTGILVFAGVAALSGILFALISPDRSNVGVPRTGSGWRGALSAFAFPRRGSRDFYLAFTGKFLMVAAGMAVTNYQLSRSGHYQRARQDPRVPQPRRRTRPRRPQRHAHAATSPSDDRCRRTRCPAPRRLLQHPHDPRAGLTFARPPPSRPDSVTGVPAGTVITHAGRNRPSRHASFAP